MENPDDIAIRFGDEALQQQHQKRLRHPLAVLFQLLFRVSALLIYLFCGWFSDSFVTCFVFIILLLSMDFWTVKNVTGRLLVGLRWWNYIDDNGQSHWVFESRKKDDIRVTNVIESQVFWISLIVTPILWFVFLLFALFGARLKWLLVDCVGLCLNGANVYGYLRCKLGDGKSIRDSASAFLTPKLFTNVSILIFYKF
ncbi:uncharacterized Golgi apparatus membrane protein-like protein CG5021 [Centruroides sculpturatus]|uniref:uncharacterized Golgi apparatus membrane protein-like protein CG5021 n=1 Tax=Centruroides sculpturatus TaxID=218467 RepID=UPI000C6D6A62|nr:uncharacterized Golgi apparatus membrane protein-like protein CG5021 [Centruroides sculpturatus]XP_023242219.1 uncharacterized Golgi apparatus membrane protein-like protein CG5021 [Centruroides sculpturatus]